MVKFLGGWCVRPPNDTIPDRRTVDPNATLEVLDVTPEKLRDILQRTRLSQYQADAYVTLVELGTASAVEIANACDVPQARIYDVLRDLEGMGYVETYERGSLHARAHEPDRVIDDLQEQAKSAIAAAEEIEARWEKPSIENHRVSVVNRFETVAERAREYVQDADAQILLAATSEQFLDLADDLQDAVDRDVVVKVSLHPSDPDHSVPIDRVRDRFEDATIEVRERTIPGPFVLIADRVGVCFAPEVVFHPSNEYGMLINDYSLGQVFKWFFETSLWEAWDEVYSAKSGDPPIPYTSIRDCIRDVEPLLDAGHEVVVSVRGRDTDSGRDVEFSGRVTNLVHAGHQPEGGGPESALTMFAERATIELDTGDETVTVGGWGAVLEDVEADQLVVESVD